MESIGIKQELAAEQILERYVKAFLDIVVLAMLNGEPTTENAIAAKTGNQRVTEVWEKKNRVCGGFH